MNNTYLVVGSKPWNRRTYQEQISKLPGNWRFISSADDLTYYYVANLQPRYIFFLHWSWKVPNDLISDYECVCFHMTDVPYGRGGSPLQNLIVRGHRNTRLSALRMVEDFDAGPVYMKSDLSLEGSSAEEIYIRASDLSGQMIATITANEPIPQVQEGDPTIFRRRKLEQSLIPDLADLQSTHDFIRMLDADGYPNAYIQYGGFRYEFSRAALYDGRIVADVTITPVEDES